MSRRRDAGRSGSSSSGRSSTKRASRSTSVGSIGRGSSAMVPATAARTVSSAVISRCSAARWKARDRIPAERAASSAGSTSVIEPASTARPRSATTGSAAASLRAPATALARRRRRERSRTVRAPTAVSSSPQAAATMSGRPAMTASYDSTVAQRSATRSPVLLPAPWSRVVESTPIRLPPGACARPRYPGPVSFSAPVSVSI